MIERLQDALVAVRHGSGALRARTGLRARLPAMVAGLALGLLAASPSDAAGEAAGDAAGQAPQAATAPAPTELASAVPSAATETGAPVAPGWTFQATLYGWATALNGQVGVRGLPPQNVDISAWDAIENLDGALMASFLAKNDDWLFIADAVYASLEADHKYGPRKNLKATVNQGQFIGSGLAGYRLPIGLPDNVDLSATVGFRYQYLDTKVRLSSKLVPGSRSQSGSQNWIDPTIGLALQWAIDEKWFLNAIADIGGFGVGSRLTAQGFGSVGYMWTPSLSTALGYRAIYTDYKNGGFVYDMTQHGVFASVGYHF